MSNEMLLETLGETLRSLDEGKSEAEARRTQHQKNETWYQQQLQQAEEQERRARKEDSEIVGKMETLRQHINSQQNPPVALTEKFMELQSQQMAGMRKVNSATDHATNMRSALKRAQMDVAGVEQELAALQSQWNEIAGQITTIAHNSTK